MNAPPRPRIIRGFDPLPASPSAPDPHASALPGLRDCCACPIRDEALQVVPGDGPLTARVMAIGQNPGDEEDVAGRPFVGASGEEFNRWLRVLELTREQVYVTNVCKCHTFNNRALRTSEIQTCSNLWLGQEFAQLTQLQVVLPLGKPAVERLLGRSAPPLLPLSIHHITIKIQGREVSVFPLPHPAFLLRAQHFGATFREVLLPQVRETLRQARPTCFDAS